MVFEHRLRVVFPIWSVRMDCMTPSDHSVLQMTMPWRAASFQYTACSQTRVVISNGFITTQFTSIVYVCSSLNETQIEEQRERSLKSVELPIPITDGSLRGCKRAWESLTDSQSDSTDTTSSLWTGRICYRQLYQDCCPAKSPHPSSNSAVRFAPNRKHHSLIVMATSLGVLSRKCVVALQGPLRTTSSGAVR